MLGVPLIKGWFSTSLRELPNRMGLDIKARDPAKACFIGEFIESPYTVVTVLYNVKSIYIDMETHYRIPKDRINYFKLAKDRFDFVIKGEGETTFEIDIPEELKPNFRSVLVNGKVIYFTFTERKVRFRVPLSEATITLSFVSTTSQMGAYASSTFILAFLIALLRSVFPKS